MTDNKNVSEILGVFSQYGFKKTSMEDIASAAGISRQSIYNRFGSKEAIFDWAVLTFIKDMLQTVTDTLNPTEPEPMTSLAQAYDIWIASQFPLWCGTSHGAEIMDLAIAAANRASFDLEGEVSNAVSGFLLDSGLAADQTSADNQTFVLELASKGLLMNSKSAEAFSRDMMRVISTTLG